MPANSDSHIHLLVKKLPPSRPRRLPQMGEGSDLEESGCVYIDADVYQASCLNMLLPKGFRIEQEDTVRRAMQQRLVTQKNSLKMAQRNAKTQQLADAKEAAKQAKF